MHGTSSFVVNELGDIHVYLTFNSIIDTKQLQPLLVQWLELEGLSSQISLICLDDPLELPLQKDFCFLSQDSRVVARRQDIAPEAAVAMFLSCLDRYRQHVEIFQSCLSRQIEILSGQTGHSPDCVEDVSSEALEEPEQLLSLGLSRQQSINGEIVSEVSYPVNPTEHTGLKSLSVIEQMQCLDKLTIVPAAKSAKSRHKSKRRKRRSNTKPAFSQLGIYFAGQAVSNTQPIESRPPP